MQTIPTQAIPRQEFTITLDGVRWGITLQTSGQATYCTILANGVAVVTGVKCSAGFQLLPARWMEGTTGNFAFATPANELPWWQNFGTTHILQYATAAELAALRGGHAPV